MEIAIVLGLLIVAIILFATEKLSVDIVTLLLLISLVLTNILTVKEAFEGFSSDFIILLGSIFIITGAIQDSGILNILISNFSRLKNKSLNSMLFVIMIVTSFLSAFMNNTTLTALLINPIMEISKKANLAASQLLLPLAYASIVGGNCTIIGTSTNVAVNGFLEKTGQDNFTLFEIYHIGIIITIAFVIYMMTIGKRFLPKRPNTELAVNYNIREYLTEIVVMPNSKLIGQTIYKSDLAKEGFRLFKIIREGEVFPILDDEIKEGDVFLVSGKISDLMRIKDKSGLEIKADILNPDASKKSKSKLGEILIPAKSDLVKATVKEINFRQRFGLVVLAVHRSGVTLKEKIGDIRLHVGDLLLVQGQEDRFTYLHENHNVLVLDEYKPKLNAKRNGFITIGLFIVALILSSLDLFPPSLCFLMAAVATVLFKAINMEKAYNLVDFRMLVLIGGMTAFGTAMIKSGTDKYLAGYVIQFFSGYGTTAILGGFIILTILLTQPMSNAAAAMVVLPIAIETALEIGVNPKTFSAGIMLAASVSLITPFEPSCILVYGPGKYKFIDFIKIGGGLTLIIIVLLLVLVPYFWPY